MIRKALQAGFWAALAIWMLSLMGCSTPTPPKVVCRHIVLAQAKALAERYDHVEICWYKNFVPAGPYTHHADVRVKINGEWWHATQPTYHYELTRKAPKGWLLATKEGQQ